ncbi:MAG: hypothetical protein ABL996_12400 [Micropepsaceae bacterium]
MTQERPDQLATDLFQRLPLTPDVHVAKFELVRDAALLIDFNQNAYRAASFLDDRIQTPATRGAWVRIAGLIQQSSQVRDERPLKFIFHTGHVGSTLVSRLLDDTGNILSLREPLPLRQLANAHDALANLTSWMSRTQFDDLLESFVRYWGRGYPTTRAVVVKATSVTGRLAPTIFAKRDTARGIYMNLRAEPYLATLLGGANSHVDLRGHAVERMTRLQALGATDLTPLHRLSIGELAAMSWLAETWSQRKALDLHGERIVAVDFDAFLADVPAEMERIAQHFGLPVDGQFLSAVARSPALTRYSKAPEHAYSPALRGEILTESRDLNKEEIRKGLAWLDFAGTSNPAAGAVIAKANS